MGGRAGFSMESKTTTQPYVGGQAVIEGVMMRSPRALAVAVRRADRSIVVREDAWIPIWGDLKFLRWPVLRGAVVLLESVYNGMQALNFSAAQAQEGEAAQAAASIAHRRAPPGRETGRGGSKRADDSDRADDSERRDGPRGSTADGRRSGGGSALTIAVALVLAFALFVGAPHLLAWGAGMAAVVGLRALNAGDAAGGAGPSAAAHFDVDTFAFHALDGLFKLAIFVGYILLISRIPEVRRIFEYHGAEHKVVNAYENGQALTVENARRWTTFHARCGTSFVLFVLVLSIFMFAAIFPLIPRVSDVALLNHLAMIGLKMPLMIPLSGLAYEINRYASKHPEQFWVQALVAPGRLMQKLTTREPSDDQLEIALAAMRAALRREAEFGEALPAAAAAVRRTLTPGQVAVFRDFGEVAAAMPQTVPSGS